MMRNQIIFGANRVIYDAMVLAGLAIFDVFNKGLCIRYIK